MSRTLGSEILVFDRSGRRLDQLRVSAHRWWKLNEYGGCAFEIPRKNAKATAANLQFGNLLLVRRAGLPDWGGVIDTPRERGHGLISVNAYSAEYLLSFRQTPRNQVLTASAGANFAEVIAIANHAENLNIRLGQVEDTGTGREDALKTSNELGLYDDVCQIAEDSGHDWYILPKLDAAGRLWWEASFVKKRGLVTNCVLKQGRHIVEDNYLLTEQGRIINELSALADGGSQRSTCDVETKSAGRYGLRQGSEMFDTESRATLEENGRTRAKYWRYPRVTVAATVVDVDNVFASLDTGNTVGIELPKEDWTGNVRVLGLDYSDDENDCELTADEIVEEA